MRKRESGVHSANDRRPGARKSKPERQAAHFRAHPLRPTDPSLRPKGPLLIIGGHEDKTGERLILRALAQRVGSGKLVVSCVATEQPDETWREYEAIFRALGVAHVHKLNVLSRSDAESPRSLRVLEDATAVFFSGGDQLRITSALRDTPVYSRVLQIFAEGGTIAGTSAGASMMSDTMIVGGGQNGSHRIGSDAIDLAPNDQFRGARGRRRVRRRRSTVTQTNVAEEERDRAISVYNTTVHVLTQGNRFALETRTPIAGPACEIEEELGLAAG